MQIETIFLKNFRCFGPAGQAIDIASELTALVGANGAGKTALMAALLRLFGVSARQRTVTPRDFHLPADRSNRRNGDSFTIEAVIGFPELEPEWDGDDKTAVPEFFSQMFVAAEGGAPKVRISLRCVWSDDGTTDGVIEEDIRWIPTLDADYEWEKCRRVAAIERSTIQVIYIPATRNTSEPINNLLRGRLWRAAKWSEDLKNAVEENHRSIQETFGDEKPSEFVTTRLKERWQQLHSGDTDTTPRLKLIDDNVPDLVRRAEFVFHPGDDGNPVPFDDLSDGQKSLFHIALTAATLQIERDALALAGDAAMFDQERIKRVHLTLLAIEEPENSLSPFFLSRIIHQAREIATLSSAQVIVSSHSASILGRIEPDEVRYFRKDQNSRTSTVRTLTLPREEEEAGRYVRLAVKSHPELYFARLVILGEGDSERIVIPRIANAMGVPLDTSFVPVVPLGGRYPTHFWRLLNDLDIPHVTLLDLDYGRQHGGAKAAQATIASLREVGRDLSGNPHVLFERVDLSKVDHLTDDDFVDGFKENTWLQMLAHEGVFFSDPLDLDFSMLAAFPQAYQHPNRGGKGPRNTPDSVAEKKRISLKSGGDPDRYTADWDTVFTWYPYLFLSHSKPERHLSALARLDDVALKKSAPTELKALVKHVEKLIFPRLEA